MTPPRTDPAPGPAPRARTGGSPIQDHPDHLARWLEGGNPGPLVIEVGPIHGCNHNCVHCGFQQYDPYGKERDYLDSGAFQRFLREFRELGGVQVYFAGNGEPLLHPSLGEWIRYGRELGISMTLSTNGILLVDKKVEEMIPHVSWIRCSVNGGDSETYARVHACKPREFEILLGNLGAAVVFRDATGAPARILIQCVTYDLNWRSVPALVKAHLDLGTDLLIFRNVMMKDGTSAAASEEILDALRAVEGEPRVQVRWDTFRATASEIPWTRCDGIYFRTNMDHQGNLVACNRDLVVPSVYGNIHERSFKEIWNGSARERMFREIACGSDRLRCGRFCQTSYDNVFLDSVTSRP